MPLLALLGDLVNISDTVMLTRLLGAVILGAVVGYEREKAGKIAGLRTHTLVALGSCLFTVMSLLLYSQVPSVNGVPGYDYHLVANIIVGIGFIGAGSIMRKDDKIHGTTTAASLWVVAAVGMAAGFGFYREAILTTGLAYGVLTGLYAWEKRLRSSVHYMMEHPQEAASVRADEKSAGS